jgi:DNA mismatch repair protein MutL
MTVQQASSQQLLFPLDLFSNRNGAYRRVETCLVNTGFVFEDTSEDHVVISGTPVNVTESEVSLVLEQLL